MDYRLYLVDDGTGPTPSLLPATTPPPAGAVPVLELAEDEVAQLVLEGLFALAREHRRDRAVGPRRRLGRRGARPRWLAC